MPQIILDTSVVVPRLDERDALRQPAMSLWTALEQQSWEVLFFERIFSPEGLPLEEDHTLPPC